MQARVPVLMLLSIATCLVCAVAWARPPAPSSARSPSEPVVGRVQVHDGVLDLTRSSIAEGGPAHEVAKGIAADLDERLQRRSGDREQRDDGQGPAGERRH